MDLFYNKEYYDFSDNKIKDIISSIGELVLSSQKNDFRILIQINSLKLAMNIDENAMPELCYGKLKNNKPVSFYQTMLNVFGFEQKTVYRYLQVFNRFINGADFENKLVNRGLLGFSVSKLAELLSLDDESINILLQENKLFPSLTQKAIRALVKARLDQTRKKSEKKTKTIDMEEFIPFNEKHFSPVNIEILSKHSKDSLVKYIIDLQNYLTGKLKN